MKVLKELGKVFAVILSIFVTIVSFLMIFYISVNKFMSNNNLKKILNTSNILKKETNGITIEDRIIGVFEEFDISQEDAKVIISSQEFTNLMDDYISKMADYYLLDKDFPELDSDMFNNLLEVVMSKNKSLNDLQKDDIKNELIKVKEKIEKSLPDKEEIKNYNSYREVSSFYFSLSIFYFIGAIIIFMFLIFVFTYSLYKPFKYIGISLIVSGCLFMIPYTIFDFLINLINVDIFFIVVIKNFAFNFFITSLMIFCIGILFVVFYTIINNWLKNKEVK